MKKSDKKFSFSARKNRARCIYGPPEMIAKARGIEPQEKDDLPETEVIEILYGPPVFPKENENTPKPQSEDRKENGDKKQ